MLLGSPYFYMRRFMLPLKQFLPDMQSCLEVNTTLRESVEAWGLTSDVESIPKTLYDN